jgi:hypothetical protein
MLSTFLPRRKVCPSEIIILYPAIAQEREREREYIAARIRCKTNRAIFISVSSYSSAANRRSNDDRQRDDHHRSIGGSVFRLAFSPRLYTFPWITRRE